MEKVISTCKLERQQIDTDKESAFQFTENVTFATVNTCTGEQVGVYTTPQITGVGGSVIFLTLFVCIILVAIIAASRDTVRYF